jgi:hypothetical protein
VITALIRSTYSVPGLVKGQALFFLAAEEECAVHSQRQTASQTLADLLGTQLSFRENQRSISSQDDIDIHRSQTPSDYRRGLK